jgi:hypothetical protein
MSKGVSMNLSTILLALFLSALALPALAPEHNSKLVEAAKKEGKLTVYTSMNQRGATLLVQELKKRYPLNRWPDLSDQFAEAAAAHRNGSESKEIPSRRFHRVLPDLA